jgi:hypothetical protein
MNKVLNAPIPRPSVVSPIATPALDQVVTRAMAKKKEHRYQSAAEFNAALQAALTEPNAAPRPTLAARPALAAHAGPPPQPGMTSGIGVSLSPRRARRQTARRWPVLAGLALLVAGIAAVGVRLAGVWTPDRVAVADIKPNVTPAVQPPLTATPAPVPAPTTPSAQAPEQTTDQIFRHVTVPPVPAPQPPDQTLAAAPPDIGPEPGELQPDIAAPPPLPPLELGHNDPVPIPPSDMTPRPTPEPPRRPDISPARKTAELPARPPLAPENARPPRRPGPDVATADDLAGRFVRLASCRRTGTTLSRADLCGHLGQPRRAAVPVRYG